MKEAFVYEKLPDNKVRCHLCGHRCLIRPGNRGICNVRQNRDGMLESLVYGRLVARNVDPIEKKPVFHMLPGSLSYSVATVGCNFKCLFCQNSSIAQMPADNGVIMGHPATPEDVVADALQEGCQSIAYTYTEPTIFFEFALETAKLAHEKGLKNVWVSNGHITPEALDIIGPYIDAANIDLKGFTDEFYRIYCAARLEPVKETLRQMKKRGIMVEVTTLIIPKANDNPEELRALAGFIASDLGVETPWHISRFHPAYNLTEREATPLETMAAARNIGIEAGLKYVYLGNVPGRGGEDTLCPGCKSGMVRRMGFEILFNRIKDGKCPDCGTAIYGKEMDSTV